MKCRFFNDERRLPKTDEEKKKVEEEGELILVPAGTIFEGKHAPFFVRMGMAEPVDDECRIAAKMSNEKIAQARKAQESVRLGILPYDYQAFLKGYMIGYDETGEWIPGPNYAEYESTLDTQDTEQEVES